MNKYMKTLTASFVALTIASCSSNSEKAETADKPNEFIYYNGQVVDKDKKGENFEWESIVTRDGKIIYKGNASYAQENFPEAMQKDISGSTLVISDIEDPEDFTQETITEADKVPFDRKSTIVIASKDKDGKYVLDTIVKDDEMTYMRGPTPEEIAAQKEAEEKALAAKEAEEKALAAKEAEEENNSKAAAVVAGTAVAAGSAAGAGSSAAGAAATTGAIAAGAATSGADATTNSDSTTTEASTSPEGAVATAEVNENDYPRNIEKLNVTYSFREKIMIENASLNIEIYQELHKSAPLKLISTKIVNNFVNPSEVAVEYHSSQAVEEGSYIIKAKLTDAEGKVIMTSSENLKSTKAGSFDSNELQSTLVSVDK